MPGGSVSSNKTSKRASLERSTSDDDECACAYPSALDYSSALGSMEVKMEESLGATSTWVEEDVISTEQVMRCYTKSKAKRAY